MLPLPSASPGSLPRWTSVCKLQGLLKLVFPLCGKPFLLEYFCTHSHAYRIVRVRGDNSFGHKLDPSSSSFSSTFFCLLVRWRLANSFVQEAQCIWQVSLISFGSWKSYTWCVVSSKEMRSWIKCISICLNSNMLVFFLPCHMWPIRSTVMEICRWNMKNPWQCALPFKFCTLDSFERLMSDLSHDAELETCRPPYPGNCRCW